MKELKPGDRVSEEDVKAAEAALVEAVRAMRAARQGLEDAERRHQGALARLSDIKAALKYGGGVLR